MLISWLVAFDYNHKTILSSVYVIKNNNKIRLKWNKNVFYKKMFKY